MSDSSVIEIYSDLVCPWCFIGKRRLEKAMSLLNRDDVQLRWRAFDLNPGTPKEGIGWQEFMMRKFGSAAYARQLEAHVAAAAQEDGIELRFDKIERLPNTINAHRLLWLAAQSGKQAEVADRLYVAYFSEGHDIGKHEELIRIGTEAGLDADRVTQMLESDEGTSEILAEQRQAHQLGVHGVPTFFLNGTPMTSGAHPPATLASLIGKKLPQCAPDNKICS